MAGHINSRRVGSKVVKGPLIQSPDHTGGVNVDLDEGLLSNIDGMEGRPVIFSKSTDARRRLEDKLEVKLLKDQLGMDDLGT